MPHSKLVRDFWNDMNRHPEARYKKLSERVVLECERWIPQGEDTRGRVVAWCTTDTGWGKPAEYYGLYDDCLDIYSETETFEYFQHRIEVEEE